MNSSTARWSSILQRSTQGTRHEVFALEDTSHCLRLGPEITGKRERDRAPPTMLTHPVSGVGFCIVPGVQQSVLSCQPADLRTVGMTVITKLEKVILLELTFLDLNSDKRGQRAAVLCYLFV